MTTLALVAPVACVLFSVGCLLLGNRYPFSKFELYADAGHRSAGAVPLFLADGQEANISDYTAFSGLVTEEFLPSNIPTSVTWMVEEARRWVDDHPATDGEGPTKVAFGFRILRIGDDGTIVEEQRLLQKGTAWKRV